MNLSLKRPLSALARARGRRLGGLAALTLALTMALTACTTEAGKSDSGAAKVRIQGSTTVNPIMAELAESLRSETLSITVDTRGGSSGGITAAGEGSADIGMASKPLSDKDRARFPGVTLKVHEVGYDAVAVVVSAPVWEGGVKALTKAQLADIFLGKVTNWKAVGGPDKPIFLYNKEPGRGTLAVFETFVFGGTAPEHEPLKNYAEVGGNEETRQKIESHESAIGQLSAAWAEDREKLKIVAIKTKQGDVLPTSKAIRERRYPMYRALRLITRGEPKGAVKTVIDAALGEAGQAIVKKIGYLPVAGGE